MQKTRPTQHPRFIIIKNILSHYRCPVECGAHCCKREKIYIGADDRDRMCRSHNQYKKMIEKSDSIEYGPYMLNYPCPFLQKDNCIVQKHKPLTCAVYPFKVGANVPTGHVALQACPMSADISHDLLNMRTSILFDLVSKNMIERGNLERLLLSFSNAHTALVDDIPHFKTKERIKELYVSWQEMGWFANYLTINK